MSRNLSPYERNQLRRAKIDPNSLDPNEQTPVEYITGLVEFCGLKFVISSAVLIPRVETEELVELALNECRRFFSHQNPDQEKIKIADIGTGSGVIALSIADKLLKRHLPFKIMASDISSKALAVAAKNKNRLLTAKALKNNRSSIKLITSSLLTDVPNNNFDLMIANLPYVPSSRLPHLDPSVTDYEPRQAIDGGKTGLALIKEFLTQAPEYLAENGVILLETDHTHQKNVFAPLRKSWQIELLNDSLGKQRFARLTKK